MVTPSYDCKVPIGSFYAEKINEEDSLHFFMIEFSTSPLWRKVNLPWFSATVHMFDMWPKIKFGDAKRGHVHSLHFPNLL